MPVHFTWHSCQLGLHAIEDVASIHTIKDNAHMILHTSAGRRKPGKYGVIYLIAGAKYCRTARDNIPDSQAAAEGIVAS